jgi:hypothetical protein
VRDVGRSPDYWHAVGMLRLDRSIGLAELERCFATGKPAEGMVGARRGRLLAATCGFGFDGALEAFARAWMPWRGKRFSREANEGRNLFTAGGRRAIRISFPRYTDLREEDGGASAFRFRTDVGPSETLQGTSVLRLDYREVSENPAFPVRRMLDELVQIDDDLYLGQALMAWGGRMRRTAWFSLEPDIAPTEPS